jgi:hypothetical protein
VDGAAAAAELGRSGGARRVSSDRSEIVRSDWTRLELFIAGARGWKTELRVGMIHR